MHYCLVLSTCNEFNNESNTDIIYKITTVGGILYPIFHDNVYIRNWEISDMKYLNEVQDVCNRN